MQLDTLVQTLANTHQSLQQQAVQAVNFSLVARNWLFGYYIVEFEQQGEERAKYGSQLLPKLSEKLKASGISGCSVSNLRNFRQLYQTYAAIRQTVSGEFGNPLSLKELIQYFRLSWSHYQVLMTLENADERNFYEIEAATNQWSTRELQRQMASALFERLALSRDTDEIKRLASEGQIVESPRDVGDRLPYPEINLILHLKTFDTNALH